MKISETNFFKNPNLFMELKDNIESFSGISEIIKEPKGILQLKNIISN